jgi:hypothetical protein
MKGYNVTSEGRKPIPKHPELEHMKSHLPNSKEPETYAEQLLEYIGATFMFDAYGFPGFEDGVDIVGKTLKEYDIPWDSEEGRFIIEGYFKYVMEGMFGDFEHWAYCKKCREEFMHEYTVGYVYQVLNNDVEVGMCPECVAKRRESTSP